MKKIIFFIALQVSFFNEIQSIDMLQLDKQKEFYLAGRKRALDKCFRHLDKMIHKIEHKLDTLEYCECDEYFYEVGMLQQYMHIANFFMNIEDELNENL